MLRSITFGLLTAAILPCGPAFPAKVSPAKTETRYGLEKLPCVAFSWNHERNVMYVPVSMNGKPYTYQLDTGADEVIPYGKGEHSDWETKHVGVRIPNVTFAGTTFSSIVAYRFPQVSDLDIQGTIGLDLLMGRVFVIDFPKQKICLFSRADIPDALDSVADWSPAEVRHGKFFITAEFNHQPLKGIFYDTGSSPSTMIVDYALWERLTTRKKDEESNTNGDATSWGTKQHYVGAPAKGVLRIGTHTFASPHVDTNTSKPNDFHENDQAQGLLGNALFMKSIVILDLGSHAQFGLISDPR